MNRSKTEQARSSRLRRVAPILLLACIAAGCEAVMAALPIAMGFARNAMQVNDENYGADSVAQLEKLFESYFPAGTAVSATTTAAVATEQTEAPEEPTEVVTEVPDRPPLALDTALLRDDTPRSRGIRGGNADTKFELTALDADAVLRDGVHRDERGDRLRISFAAHEACWVYVVEIDATGYVVPVFPNPAVSTGSNP